MINKKSGFILNELLIVIVVSAILSGIGIGLIMSYFNNQKNLANRILLNEIGNALTAYYDFNGFLPCPASLTKTPNDNDMGDMQNCLNSTIESYSDVVIGAVPFKTLGLRKSHFANLFQNKFVYVIPRKLGQNANKFQDFNDVVQRQLISIKNNDGHELQNGQIGFLVIDHGNNENGVYKLKESSAKQCTVDNCRANEQFFANYDNRNIFWRDYNQLMKIDSANEINDNIIVDKIWVNKNDPPNQEGIYLILNADGYRKLSGKTIRDYSIVEVYKSQNRISYSLFPSIDPDKIYYRVLKYLKPDDKIFHKNEGNFIVTHEGLRYIGMNFEDFHSQTLKIKDFRDDLSRTSTSTDLFILNKLKSSDIDKLDISNIDKLYIANIYNFIYLTIKSVDGGNFLVTYPFNNQTILDADSGQLKKYHEASFRWINWENISEEDNNAPLNGWCGGKPCSIPGVRPCGPLMPGMADVDIYGRIVVRDMMVGKNDPAIFFGNNPTISPTVTFWPSSDNPKHHGLYFSYWSLDTDDGEKEHPSKKINNGTFSSGMKRFLVKLNSDEKWYKYTNNLLGIGEEEDIESIFSEKGIRTFEICKEGIGVFAPYQGMIFDVRKDNQAPFLAVLTGEPITVDHVGTFDEGCCEGIKNNRINNGVYLHRYLMSSYRPSGFKRNNFRCFEEENHLLYHINPDIGQLNPVLGGFSNNTYTVKATSDSNISNSIKAKDNNILNPRIVNLNMHDPKYYSEYANKNGHWDTFISHLQSNNESYIAAMDLDASEIWQLNTDSSKRQIKVNNCYLELQEEFKYKVKLRKVKIGTRRLRYITQDYGLLWLIDNYSNTYNAAVNSMNILKNKMFSVVRDESLLCYESDGGINSAFFVLSTQMHNGLRFDVACNNADLSWYQDSFNNFWNNSGDFRREKHQINFGKIYLGKT